FHVFGIGQRSIGFSVRIEVKTGSKVSEVTLGPQNRTVTSNDNFLRVNLIGDFVGYTNIPSFEEFYLVIPRQGGSGQQQDLGRNFSMWMLLERVRFTLDGLECNKIGVSYEAFNEQPSFCSSPFWSCLHNQLWNYREADQKTRINRNQLPLIWGGRRKNAGSHSFSIGVTEALNNESLDRLAKVPVLAASLYNARLEITQDPGGVPCLELLQITTKNTGEMEASYSLTFGCSRGVTLMEEQYFIMKPKETSIQSFKLYPTTDQAAKYTCSAILKDSDFNEVDRAECQFSTMAMVLDNGSQITPFQPPKTSINGFFESIESMGKKLWEGLMDFITGKTCRRKCSSFFDFSCHIQYICMSWIVMFGLVLAIFPTLIVLLWLLHQKESLILFMTGGKIVFRVKIREQEVIGGTILKLITPTFMLENLTSRKASTISMVLDVDEVLFTCMTIHRGTVIIIIIFTMFTNKSISMGTVRIHVSGSNSTLTEGRMTILGIIDTER
ncbi:hapless 2, partial [Melia azedarach]